MSDENRPIRQKINEARRGVFSDVGKALDDILQTSEISTLAGQRDVVIDNLQDGQVIKYNAELNKWINGTAVVGEGEFQASNSTLTAISLLAPASGVFHETSEGVVTKLPIGGTAGTVAAGDHQHNAQYAPISHNHDTSYSSITHNHDTQYAITVHYHDETYSPLSHNHDDYYISVVTTPTTGNFPVLTAGGELLNSAFGPSSFVSPTISVTGQHSVTGGGDLSTNRVLSLVGDTASPGINQVYGTNASGVRVWKPDPAGGAGTVIEGTGLLPVTNIAALRDVIDQVDGQVIYVKGYYAAGDGGGGVFRWDAAEAAQMVTAVAIAAAGTAYTVGSELRVTGGTGTVAIVHVDAVGGAGEVTAVRIIDPGKYTANPTTTGAATIWAWGTGCTLNLTMGPYNNGGTIIVPTGHTAAGRWKRVYSGPVDVKWFGAKANDSGFMCHDHIQAAIAASKSVYVSDGDYYISKPIILNHRSIFFGTATNLSAIRGETGFTDCLVRTYLPLTSTQSGLISTYRKEVEVRDMTFKGFCLHALAIVRGNVSYVDKIRLEGTSGMGVCNTTSHGIVIEDCWSGSFKNLWFNGANVGLGSTSDSACLYVGRDANAINVENIMTSNTCKWGIYHHGGTGGVAGHGTWYSNICIQGHADVGIWIKSNGYNGTIINGIYSEGCVAALRLGDLDSNDAAIAVTVNGGVLMASNAVNVAPANIQIYKGRNVHISGVSVSNSNYALTTHPDGTKRAAIIVASGYNIRLSAVTVSQDSELINHIARTVSSSFIDVSYSERNVTITGHPTVSWFKPAGTSVPAGKLVGSYFDYTALAQVYITDRLVYSTTWTF